MELALVILVGLLVYVFAAFPSILMLLSLLPGRRMRDRHVPTVTVLIAARNERARIRTKIMNTLASDYPEEKLKILVGSDGSTDGTDEEVSAIENARVRLVSLPEGTGKTSTINSLAHAARTDVLVVSDADVLIDGSAIGKLVKHFADPKVGAVCGRRADRTERPGDVGRPARLYNLYEGAIKHGEGRMGRVLGGNGSLYAIRRFRFNDLPPDVPDDFVNILRVLEQGDRVAYEDAAVSEEELPDATREEFVRRRRTIARGIRGLWSVRGLLNPLRFPLTSFLLFSHKILRWCAGLLMIGAFILNMLLVSQPFYRWLFIAQSLFYATALVGVLTAGHGTWRLVRMIRYFVLSNLAGVAGIIDVALCRDWRSWSAERGSDGPSAGNADATSADH